MEKEKDIPFTSDEIDDVRIIIKAKGKHYGIVPKKDCPNIAKQVKLSCLSDIMEFHDIVSTALEDIKPEKLKDGKV